MADQESEPRAIVRGSPLRITDHMEAFQRAYVTALAAASGITVSVPVPDPGIDMILSHFAPVHREGVAHLEVSLKATSRKPARKATTLSVQIRRDRFDYLRTPGPTISKILVLMVVPQAQDAWVRASASTSVLHHAAYWVNLEGHARSMAAEPSVAVPLVNLLDDVALCDMMIRIGEGGRP